MDRMDLYRRFLVVLLGLAQPIIILIVCGPIVSISSSWETVLQPLFIFTNAITSYFFFDAHRWRLPSMFLLLLTAFSVSTFPMFHNFLATCFFLSCFYPLFMLKRFRSYFWFLFIGVPLGYYFGLFWGEMYGAYILSIYHLRVVWHMYKLGIRRRHNLPD